ncbi:MAG: nitrilase [Deltaproteobacteria bacterium]|nr:nitrilase [Deltaproteobacteria bacterium]
MISVRIAAVVFNSPRGNTRANLDRMEDWVAGARAKGAGIVCFPELNITGYGTDAGMQQEAQPVPGLLTERICAMAARHGLVILAGLAEQAGDGRICASHLVVAPAGLLGRYRKLHIAPPEQPVFSAGDRVPIFEACGIRFGIQLCYDAHFPELSARMALDGADVIFMPHASPRGSSEEKRSSWMRHLPARAFDNGVFVVACNQAGDNGAGLTFPGLAMAIGPDGRVIAAEAGGQEGLLVTDLDAARLAAVRSHPMRYFPPHRRPDIYRLAE